MTEPITDRRITDLETQQPRRDEDIKFLLPVLDLLKKSYISDIQAARAIDAHYEQISLLAKEVTDLAMTDPLTGVLNRRGLESKLQNVISSRITCGFLALDIDDMKALNDTYGHSAGDEGLKAVVGAIRSQTREGDLIARFGGDEFFVVLPGVTNDSALRDKGEALRTAINETPVIVGPSHAEIPVSITTSIGGFLNKDFRTQFGQAADLADKMLYQSKNAGGNSVSILGLETEI